MDALALTDIYSPSHFVFRSAQITPDQSSEGNLLWNDITALLGAIPVGGAVDFTVGFTVATTASPVINRVEVVSGLDENGDALPLTGAQAEVAAEVAAIDLTIGSDPPANSSVLPGDCIVYDLTVTNTGATDLTNTTLTVFPPEGTTPVDECPPETRARLTAPQNHEPPVTFALGTLALGATETRQLRVTVNGDIQVLDIILAAEARSDQTGDFATTSQTTVVLDPTAITLLRFTARSQPGGVQVEWLTGAEANAWGFHLWRTASDRWGDGMRVTPGVIPAQGRNGSGAAYAFFDPGGKQGDYYWLQEIESDGALNLYGPVRVDALTYNGLNRNLFLPLVGR